MRRASTNGPWLLAILVGACLRLHRIADQVLVDDEWHALHKLLASGPLGIVTDFGASDHSIPLTLLYALLEHTVGLDELRMRLPSLVAGIAAPAVVPWLVREAVGARAAVVLAWLLAVSPLHVFYSRYARPYEPAMLLALVALLAGWRWIRGEGSRTRWRAAFAASAVLAPWLLPPVAPVAALPVVLAAAAAVASPRVARGRRRELAGGVLLVVAGWIVCLAPPLAASGGTLGAKLGRGSVEGATLVGAAELLLGTASHGVLALCLVVASLGAVVLARRARSLAALLAVACIAQGAAVVLLAPHGLRFPIVLARYLLVLSPVLLLALAAGVAAIDGALPAMRGVRAPLASAALVATLVVTGPLPWIHRSPNDFTSHLSYQADYVPGRYFERFRPAEVPAFYTRLAERAPGRLTIVEAPWHFFWHSLAWYQRLHRQHVVVGFVDPALDAVRDGEAPRGRRRIRLRNALHVDDAAALEARGVDYVVFHRDALAEMRVPFAAAPVDVSGWIARYRERYGAPVYEDRWITVFAVAPGARPRG